MRGNVEEDNILLGDRNRTSTSGRKSSYDFAGTMAEHGRGSGYQSDVRVHEGHRRRRTFGDLSRKRRTGTFGAGVAIVMLLLLLLLFLFTTTLTLSAAVEVVHMGDAVTETAQNGIRAGRLDADKLRKLHTASLCTRRARASVFPVVRAVQPTAVPLHDPTVGR